MKPKMTIDDCGIKCWRINGKFHREDGPAIEWFDGDKDWCLDGIYLSEKRWLNKVLFNEVKIIAL